MTTETKKWWNAKSKYYQSATNIPVKIHYGPGTPFEDELKLLGNLKNKNILEIGCGGAQCGIAMAKCGANVTAIDISDEQLKFAKELAKQNGASITLYQGDVKKLPQIKSNSQDIVFSAWALFYVDDLDSCYKEVYRVLKKGGIFVVAMPNPIYFAVNPKTLIVNRSYFDTGKHSRKEKQKSGKTNTFVCYDRTISELINTFIRTGLILETVLEPDSRKHYKSDPWYGIWEFTPKLMKYIPPTIIFKARK